MTTPDRPSDVTALLLEGINAAFATAQGNIQTPQRIMAFLTPAYIPALIAAVHADATRATRSAPMTTATDLAERMSAIAELADRTFRPTLHPDRIDAWDALERILALAAPESEPERCWECGLRMVNGKHDFTPESPR